MSPRYRDLTAVTGRQREAREDVSRHDCEDGAEAGVNMVVIIIAAAPPLPWPSCVQTGRSGVPELDTGPDARRVAPEIGTKRRRVDRPGFPNTAAYLSARGRSSGQAEPQPQRRMITLSSEFGTLSNIPGDTTGCRPPRHG